MEGLEPPRREAPDPKSGAATNYATCAFKEQFLKPLKNLSGCKSRKYFIIPAIIGFFSEKYQYEKHQN
jgi:hypothetical protein